MKQICFYLSITMLLSNCSLTKNSSSVENDFYKNTYDDFLEETEIKIFSWYQGVTSSKENKEYIVRTFYPETKQITSLYTYKYNDRSVLDGPTIIWADNGNKMKEGNYKDGNQDGYWKTFYYENEQVLSEGFYKKGQENGLWKNYNYEGKIVSEITWVNGVKEGKFIEYDTTGNISNTGIYKQDSIIQQTNVESENRIYGNGDWFTVVEEMPYLKECSLIEDVKERKAASDQLLLKYIYSNISYPPFARENAVEGMALLSFTVMEDGRIEDVYTISGLCKSVEEECLKIVKNMPPWNPGKQEGKNVRVKYNLPIRFMLN